MFDHATQAQASWVLWYTTTALPQRYPGYSCSLQGNKGATAIRTEFTPKMTSDSESTTYRSTIFTFVNAHLAASDEMVERRNYDFQEVSGRLAFSLNGSNQSYMPNSFAGDTYSIFQTDVLFWMVRPLVPGK